MTTEQAAPASRNDPIAARVARRLAAARRVLVLTGAGMSAESGIPTFRGARNGLWARFDPMTLATPSAFAEDPALVWGWYRWRTALVERAAPNTGHRALAALARHRPDLMIVTQNVDDLHERAGSTGVIHLHGSLFAPRCAGCGRPHPNQAADDTAVEIPMLRVPPPTCADCGAHVRPGVVWFGEALPQAPWREAAEAAAQAELVLVVGTSGLVRPAADLPRIARRNGATLIEINPEPGGLDEVDVGWRTTAAIGLPAIVAALDTAAPQDGG